MKTGRKMIDLTGQRFGQWIVIAFAGIKNRQSRWRCCCDCGTEKIVRSDSLKSGDSLFCGSQFRHLQVLHGGKKYCNKCGQVKSFDGFYFKSNGKLAAICKSCRKRSSDLRYLMHSSYIKEQTTRYHALHPAQRKQISAKWQRNNRIKRRAHWHVWKAMRDGKLIRPAVCQSCKKTTKLHAHHDDYSKPLDVQWLCSGCHAWQHRRLRGKKWL